MLQVNLRKLQIIEVLLSSKRIYLMVAEQGLTKMVHSKDLSINDGGCEVGKFRNHFN